MLPCQRAFDTPWSVLFATGIALSWAGEAAAQVGWVDRSPPWTTNGMAMTYDEARGAAIIFGGTVNFSGSGQANLVSESWTWDGTTYVRQDSPEIRPRRWGALAYDAGRQRTVLFGGYVESYEWRGPIGDTWEHDGRTWSLRATSGPSPRYGHTMAYDSRRHVTVLFGGTDDSARLGDTWEWDGDRWTERKVAEPPARSGHGMVFDSARGVCVAFGGNGENERLGETWEWDGTTWALRSTDGPAPRDLPTMTFLPTTGRTFLLGGTTSNGPDLAPWDWDGQRWIQRPELRPEGVSATHAMIYDSRRSRAVLLATGEVGFPRGPARLLEFDGSQWATRSDGAPVRYFPPPVMTFDSDRNVVVLYSPRWDSHASAQTWEWDGNVWRIRVSGVPDVYPPCALAYDASRRASILAGWGSDASGVQTWAWDGVQWMLLAVGYPPYAAYNAVYDSARGVIIAQVSDDTYSRMTTWEFEGNTWSWRSSDGPPLWPVFDRRRGNQAIAYDTCRNVTVCFDPSTEAQTWEWDGTRWTIRSPANSPTSYPFQYALTFDLARNVTVMLYTVSSTTGWADEFWEWDGDTWRENSGLGGSARAVTYDNSRHALFAVGPMGGSTAVANEPPEPRSGLFWELRTDAIDSDHDGVVDVEDPCRHTTLVGEMTIDGCATGVLDAVGNGGCSLGEMIVDCERAAENHGEFVRCTGEAAHHLQQEGVLEPGDVGKMQHCAGQADIPRSHAAGDPDDDGRDGKTSGRLGGDSKTPRGRARP